jgi:hypothetical protein
MFFPQDKQLELLFCKFQSSGFRQGTGRSKKSKKLQHFWNAVDILKGRDHSEDLGVKRVTLDWILGKYGEKVGPTCIWIRIGTSGGLL